MAQNQLIMEPFIAEIRMFAGNFAPRGWAFCEGQLLSIPQHQALFSLLGTMYGGDGRTTFGLPDLRGRVPMGVGQGPGLSNHPQGQKGGQETVTLTTNEIPSHNHGVSEGTINASASLNAFSERGNSNDPTGRRLANSGRFDIEYLDAGTEVQMESGAVKVSGTVTGQTTTNTGGTNAHSNLQPFTTIRFIIALQGIYPSRS